MLHILEPNLLHEVTGGVRTKRKAPKPLRLSSDKIDGWSNGGYDFYQSHFLDRLYDLKDQLADSKAHSITVPLVITK